MANCDETIAESGTEQFGSNKENQGSLHKSRDGNRHQQRSKGSGSDRRIYAQYKRALNRNPPFLHSPSIIDPSSSPRHTSSMGGNAFSEQLPTAVFPRMPPAFYNSLKSRIIPRLETLYHLVVVPPEAPEKPDHGDLDILVCQPRNVKEGIPRSECVTLEEIEQALGSVHSIPLPGDRTSNFAIPIQQDEVQHFGFDRGEPDLGQLYIQIDLHFCEDEESLRSRTLFQSYGELGMILGVLGKTVGFTWTTSGLKVGDHGCYSIPFD